ncbi:MAG: hypothetical protein DSY83_10195 [Flavobacteriia bacterium]|nr:MAG: hypothetical protein DSY83_10195 [Flavobacteriia bacterium]
MYLKDSISKVDSQHNLKHDSGQVSNLSVILVKILPFKKSGRPFFGSILFIFKTLIKQQDQ